MKKTIHFLFISLFITVISAPFVFGLLQIGVTLEKTFKYTENRTKNVFPSDDFTRQKFEEWLEDSYGFRRHLVALNAQIYRLLKVSNKPDMVVWGKDGWMFLGDMFRNVLSKHYGLYKAQEKEFHQCLTVRQAESEFLATRNIPYFIVVAPDKHSIYPEYLTPPVGSHKSEFDRFLELNKDYGVQILDLRPMMLEEKKEHGTLLYHKTDTHWSDLGSYLAYKEIVTTINQNIPGLEIKPLVLKDFKVQDYEVNFGLVKLLGIPNGYVHDFWIRPQFTRPFNKLKAMNPDNKNLPWKADKKVPNPTKVTIINEACGNTLNVLFLRDSFSSSLSEFYNQTFYKSTYIHWDQPESRQFVGLIDKYKPDIVIVQQAERSILSPLTLSPQIAAHKKAIKTKTPTAPSK